MRRTVARVLAAAMLVWTYGMILFIFASVMLPGSETLPDRPDLVGIFSAGMVFVIVPTVGAVLTILRPRNPIGWLFLASGMGFTFGIFATEYVGRAIQGETRLPLPIVFDWLGAWTGSLSVGLTLVWIPLLFPDGHLPSRRWRPVAWIAGFYLVLTSVLLAIQPTDGGYGGRLPNPIGVDWPVSGVLDSGLLVLALLGVAAFASVAVRFRRSSGVERRQLKWFLSAVGILLVAVVLALVAELEAAWYAVMLGLAALPIATAIAILRYRLYEIDRLVSRTIAYSVVTGGLVVVYLLVNLGLTSVFSSLTRGDSVAVAASTLVVAVLFTPVRRRVQALVDRRFDRARYDADRTALAFASRLRDGVDLSAVTADLDTTVRAAIAPATLGVWLRDGSR